MQFARNHYGIYVYPTIVGFGSYTRLFLVNIDSRDCSSEPPFYRISNFEFICFKLYQTYQISMSTGKSNKPISQRDCEEEHEGWRNISDRQIVKSWGGMRNFMHSYGLKEYNPEDFDEAHAIMDAMKQGQWDQMSTGEKEQARAHRAKYKY